MRRRTQQAWNHERRPRKDSLAAQLGKDLLEERRAGEDGGLLALPEQERLALRLADDEAAIVERRRVFLQPGRDLRLPARREQVREVVERVLRCGHG